MSERTALRHFGGGDWAERVAATAAVDDEASRLAERGADGEALAPTAGTAKLIMGLACTAQYGAWRALDGCPPSSIVAPLEAISELAAALTGATGDVTVARSALLATARLLGDESDAVRRGVALPPDAQVVDRAVLADRLAIDAAHARRAATGPA
jgi:hypothetical protein